MTNYKVGDKVRILDVDAILFGSAYWRNGDVVDVAESERSGIRAEITRNADWYGDDPYFHINESEFHAIELVEETPKLTKKARIEALEKASKEQAEFNEATADDFADLFERVEALEKRLDEPTLGDAITSVNDVKLGDKITVEKGFSNFLRANSSYEVVEISSEKSANGQQIIVLDDDDDEYILPSDDFSQLRKVAS